MGVKNLRNKQQKGFTLIELLVVIAIIGLLASVVLLALNSARQKARDAKRVADVRQIMSAMELFLNDNGRYPASANTTVNGVQIQAPNPADVAAGGNAFSTYLSQYPAYPRPVDNASGSAVCTETPDTGTAVYDYAQGTSGASYRVTFCLGGPTGGLAAGVHYATPGGITTTAPGF